jgi:hypothetical protein
MSAARSARSTVSSPGIVRLNNSGAVDATFATGLGANGTVYAVAVIPTNSIYNAGKVLVGGLFTNFNGPPWAIWCAESRWFVGHELQPECFGQQRGARHRDSVGWRRAGRRRLHQCQRRHGEPHCAAECRRHAGHGVQQPPSPPASTARSTPSPCRRTTAFWWPASSPWPTASPAQNITRLLPTGAVDPSINFGTGANGAVNALVIQPADGNLVIGGDFTQFNGQPREHIARIYGGSMTGSGAFQFTSGSLPDR